MTDLEHAAAVLAAAIIAQSKKAFTPEQAARCYFDCLASLHDEKKDREIVQTPGESEETKAYVREVFEGAKGGPKRDGRRKGKTKRTPAS